MGEPNSIVPYNDPHDDPMEFNFQDFMNDQNPTLADLETPENTPSPQFAFDNEPNNEDLNGDHDPIFEDLVRTLRESEASRPSSSSLAQQLSRNEHNFHGGGLTGNQFVHNLNNQSGGGGLLQPLQNQLQSLNTQGGGAGGSGGGLLPPLNPNQFENVSIQGGAGGGLLQPLQHNQFSNLNTQGGSSESLLPQLQPSRFQLQQNQNSMRNIETSNDGGGLIGNQFVHNFNSQSGGGGGLLPPLQPSQFRLQYSQLQRTSNKTSQRNQMQIENSNSGSLLASGIGGSNANSQEAGPSNRSNRRQFRAGSGSNLNSEGERSMMPSQRNQIQIENSNSGSLLASGIGGSNANSQEAGPSNRSNRRHSIRTGGSNANNNWDISQCAQCQVIREINHTDGTVITKLEIHGGLLNINHIVTETKEENKEPKYELFTFAGMMLDTVKSFLLSYCDIRRNAGFIMLDDPFSEFYDTLCVELYRRPSSSHVSDDQPVSLLGSGDRRRSDGASGSGGGSEQDRRPSRSNLARQRERTGKLTLADLSCYFHLPMEEAASRINLCLTVVKKICRRSGMNHWPHRRVLSLQKRIRHYQERLNSLEAEQRERALEIIRKSREELDHIYIMEEKFEI